MIDCPVCKSKLAVAKLQCEGCKVMFEGRFSLPRLARLEPELRQLAEQMLLCGGNLKNLAEIVGVSYPTLRRKVDDLIAALTELRRADKQTVEAILEGIEKGRIPAETGIRQIRELQGEI